MTMLPGAAPGALSTFTCINQLAETTCLQIGHRGACAICPYWPVALDCLYCRDAWILPPVAFLAWGKILQKSRLPRSVHSI